jgi:putative oxidoreductase
MRGFGSLLRPSSAIRNIVFIRVAVGLIFFTQGILKFIDPHMGEMRFTRIGFPMPEVTARFVGGFEIACGLLVLVGLLTRLASIPLLIVILTAITTTKIPELFHPGQGLVHGERCAYGFRDDDEPALPDQRWRRSMVSRLSDLGEGSSPENPVTAAKRGY